MKVSTQPDEQQDMKWPSIREKIEEARALYEEFSNSLLNDPNIRSLGDSLELKIDMTKKLMSDMGVLAACRYCDEEEGGSCCGAGIENKYSSVLLLTNLLLGGDLPDERHSSDSCYFLAQKGCMLKVRHVLCVNYLCRKIQNMLMPSDLIELQKTIGDELDTAFLLHERTMKFIRSWCHGR